MALLTSTWAVASACQFGSITSWGLCGTVSRGVTIVVTFCSRPAVLSRRTGSFDWRTCRRGMSRRGTKPKYVNRIRSRGNAQEGGAEIERHAINGRWICPTSELIQLLAPWDGKDANDGSGLACRRQKRPFAIQTYTRQRRAVGFNNIYRLERQCIKHEHFPGGGRNVCRLGWCVSWSPCVGIFPGFWERVRNETIFR